MVVDGDNHVTEQYHYNDTEQEQYGFDGSVQVQDSTSSVEQGATVTVKIIMLYKMLKINQNKFNLVTLDLINTKVLPMKQSKF